MYGSISEVAPDKETLVGCQEKWLHLMALLQSADVKPTQATVSGVKKLKEISTALILRWNKLK